MVVLSPILNRELLTFLRTKRAFGGLLLFLLVLSGAAALCWWISTLAYRSAVRDVLSRMLFYTVTIAQLAIFAAYALILTCTKVNGERDTRTFDLLACAPLSSLHIVLAKYASALAVILLLLFATAPILSLCFLLGGVGWWEVTSAYSITLLTVLAYGMIGMACSTVCRKNYVALAASFSIVLLIHFGPGLVYWFLAEVFEEWFDSNALKRDERYLLTIIQATTGIGAYAAANLGMPTFFSRTVDLVLHTAFHFFLFVVSFLVAWIGFRRLAGRREERLSRRDLRALTRAKTPSTRKKRKKRRAEGRRPPRPIPDGANPVYVSESRMLVSHRRLHRFLRFAICAVAYLIIAAILRDWQHPRRGYDFDPIMCGLGLYTAIFAGIFIPLFTARAVTTERETNTLPLLLATPLLPGQILIGKLAAVLKYAVRIEVLFTFLLLFALAKWPRDSARIFADWMKVLPPLFAITLYVASVGLFFSTRCRKTVTAVVWTYAVLLALGFGMLFLIALNDEIGRHVYGEFREAVQTLLICLTPVFSPGIYFIPDNDVNIWEDNHKWLNILSYSLLMLALCAVFLAAARTRLAGAFHRSSRREGPGL